MAIVHSVSKESLKWKKKKDFWAITHSFKELKYVLILSTWSNQKDLQLSPNAKRAKDYPASPWEEVSSLEDWPDGPSLSQTIRAVVGADIPVIGPKLRMIISIDGRICSPLSPASLLQSCKGRVWWSKLDQEEIRLMNLASLATEPPWLRLHSRPLF